LPQLLEPAPSAGIASLILVPRDAAETTTGHSLRVSDAKSSQLLCFHLEVKAHLDVHLALDRRSMEDKPKPAAQSREQMHETSSRLSSGGAQDVIHCQ
jgi:hypothetical protein